MCERSEGKKTKNRESKIRANGMCERREGKKTKIESRK